jgi:predicted transcriptional regulator
MYWSPNESNVAEGENNDTPTMGINVRSDGDIDYASLIIDGRKKYESRKTDSLRPYVGKTVGIVRTGKGPAVAIGQVTIGEPIVVDAEKFNKLRKQHLVPQGSKFDIDVDGTKYLYPMINPIRWDNEKLIKHRGIVSRKIQEQGVAEDFGPLSSIVNQDQAERNEYKNFVTSKANGDWNKGAEMYAQLKKRSSDDIFGDAERLNQFMKMKFDFNKFTDKDWDNYWLLAQHCDTNRNFQKQALAIIKKYQGEDNSHYKYLYDRISVGLTGKQKYGTQNINGQQGLEQ